jgi:DNA (cytosine-5)-methyltransferase 1
MRTNYNDKSIEEVRQENMRFIDLFAGIGGFRLGMEMAGHQCAGFVEWDKYARKSYEAIHNTEGEWTWNDITTIDYRELPAADCWCFGFPCQDISLGGRKVGFKGNRSSLFFAVTKRLRQIKEWNPERMPIFLFIENVKNFLSINGGWDFLLAQAELDDIGYDCEWQLLNSRGWLPQNRERVYIIGHLRERGSGGVLPIQQTFVPTPAPRIEGFKIINMTKQGFDFAGENDSINFAFPGSNTRRGRVGRGYFQTLDTQCTQAVMDKGRWRQITPKEAWRLQGFPDYAFDRAKEALSDLTPKKQIKQLYKQAGNSVTVNVIYEIAKRLGVEE